MKKLTCLVVLLILMFGTVLTAQDKFNGIKRGDVNVTDLGYFVSYPLGNGTKTLFIENNTTSALEVAFYAGYSKDTTNYIIIRAGDKRDIANCVADSVYFYGGGTGTVNYEIHYGYGFPGMYYLAIPDSVDVAYWYNALIAALDSANIARLNRANVYTRRGTYSVDSLLLGTNKLYWVDSTRIMKYNDTTSLSHRIDLKETWTDTLNQWRKSNFDTTGIYRGTVDLTDYLPRADTINYVTKADINTSDGMKIYGITNCDKYTEDSSYTIIMLSPSNSPKLPTGAIVNISGISGLEFNPDGKYTISYKTGGGIIDSAMAIPFYIGSDDSTYAGGGICMIDNYMLKSDTLTLSNRINTKANWTDTSNQWRTWKPLAQTNTNNTFTGGITTTTSTITDSTINCNLSNSFVQTIAKSTNFTFTNLQDGQGINVTIIVGGTGSYTCAFAGSGLTVKWSGGSQPTQTVTVGQADVYTFIRQGSIIYANVVQNF